MTLQEFYDSMTLTQSYTYRYTLTTPHAPGEITGIVGHEEVVYYANPTIHSFERHTNLKHAVIRWYNKHFKQENPIIVKPALSFNDVAIYEDPKPSYTNWWA